MRVVVCFYFGDRSIPLGKDIAAAFASLGHEVSCFDSSARESWLTAKRIAKSFAKLVGAKRRLSAIFERRQANQLASDFTAFCRRIKPDFVLVIRGEKIAPETVARIASESRARTAAWWVKNPKWQDQFRAEINNFDQAFSIDESSTGSAIEYLPCWAVNRTEFFPIPFEQKEKILLFIGAWSLRRQHYLEAIADLPIRIIGPNWSRRLPVASPLRRQVAAEWVSQEIMASHYRNVWAVVDIRQIDQGWEQGVNMRFADVPASGTILLTEPSREIERWQMDGTCACLFSSPQALREQAAMLLSDTDRCRNMSQAAIQLAKRMPSFVDRAQRILDATKKATEHP